ncbi:hypothetical protein ACWDZ4_16210 [Streptomyces sp. NPDC003016]
MTMPAPDARAVLCAPRFLVPEAPAHGVLGVLGVLLEETAP